MTYRTYYVTPQEFMKHLEAAVRETYFAGDDWDKRKWHPEDIAVNLEASITVLRGYLASVIWENAQQQAVGRVAYDPPTVGCSYCEGTGRVMKIGTYEVVDCAKCNGRG